MSATFKQVAINVREALNALCGIESQVADLEANKANKKNTTLIIPTEDPLIEGALWNNAGVVTISAG